MYLLILFEHILPFVFIFALKKAQIYISKGSECECDGAGAWVWASGGHQVAECDEKITESGRVCCATVAELLFQWERGRRVSWFGPV